ncbi:MAG: outer membrane beta-barrel protein [Gammaproteobacteria bacterium]|nr:outer membrane beta-barrel protein [Gammaproteobacteria bacterium]
MKSTMRLIFVFLVFSFSIAHAEEKYVGFSLGFSAADQECDYFDYDCDGDDTFFKMYGGYKFHPNFAIEASFQDTGNIKDKSTSQVTTAKSEGINISLLALIPISEELELFAKMGHMTSDTSYTRTTTITETSSEDESNFTYGAGLLWEFESVDKNQYQLRLEFEKLQELGDQFISGGANITAWSFGGAILF